MPFTTAYLSLAMQALRVAARPTAGVHRRVLTQAVRSYAMPTTELKPSDDPQLAGYPELPYVSKQRRSPFGWDDPQMRRNFGEPVCAFYACDVTSDLRLYSHSCTNKRRLCPCGVRTHPSSLHRALSATS